VIALVRTLAPGKQITRRNHKDVNLFAQGGLRVRPNLIPPRSLSLAAYRRASRRATLIDLRLESWLFARRSGSTRAEDAWEVLQPSSASIRGRSEIRGVRPSFRTLFR
jgi:hypothetical protein